MSAIAMHATSEPETVVFPVGDAEPQPPAALESVYAWVEMRRANTAVECMPNGDPPTTILWGDEDTGT